MVKDISNAIATKEQAMEGNLSGDQVNRLLFRVNAYVRRTHLSALQDAVILPLDRRLQRISPGGNLQIMHLQSFTFQKSDSVERKLRSVYGALEHAGVSAALILDARANQINLYIGVFGETAEDTAYGYRVFRSSFDGVFPGCKYRNVTFEDSKTLLHDLMEPPVEISVAAVSAMASPDEADDPLDGLDILVDGMRGRPFTMVFLARSMEQAELVQMRQGFEALHTQVFPLQKRELSISESQTDTLGSSFSSSVTESLNVSAGISTSHSESESSSRSTQLPPGNAHQKKQMAASTLIGAGVSVLAGQMLSGGKAGENIIQSLFYSSSIANLVSSSLTLRGSSDEAPEAVYTETSGMSTSDTTGRQENISRGQSRSDTYGESESVGITNGQSVQISSANKSVVELLNHLEDQIRELERLERGGAFRAAAYFIAGDTESAVMAANLYRSIVYTQRTAPFHSPVYHWDNKEQVGQLMEYLKRGFHPEFAFEQDTAFPHMLLAQPIGLRDMPNYLCLPRKSLPGFTVTSYAAFARDILRRDSAEKKAKTAEIGCIYHMGRDFPQSSVALDVNTLTAHLFVAGATGVGKSNFCYYLLEQLRGYGVKSLIIEPAKGEYAKVFGGLEGFRVFGTNLRMAPPLRVNPFAFPKGVSASEHIERLLAIFSAAWPLYSAMPAILKDALEEIYRRKGFDEVWGDLPEGGRFPTFQDLLETLPEIIRQSDYSQEVQGNYIGALVTRVKSLTNGVYSILFTDDEIGDHALFDENVIVDISRIGSEETKALVMGVLVMRLTEYRSCEGSMNGPLRHITLLEEAHHLLGRHNSVGGEDTGNMRAASVEMICDAIREMRTYGEAFLIADQSPSVMDPSVISNTQTKVFFMMPRREDREIAGDSASLTDQQQMDLARLPRGVAAVWQNEWTDAVLCKVKHFDSSMQKPFSYQASGIREEAFRMLSQAVSALVEGRIGKSGKSSLTADLPELGDGYGLGNKRSDVREILMRYRTEMKPVFSLACTGRYLETLLNLDNCFQQCRNELQIADWVCAMEEAINRQVRLTSDETHEVLICALRYRARKHQAYQRLYVYYLNYRRVTRKKEDT